MITLKIFFTALLFITCVGVITPGYAGNNNNNNNHNSNNNNNNYNNNNYNNNNNHNDNNNNNNHNDNNNNNNHNNNNNGNTLPIDSGIVFLLVAGAAIGATVIYKNNKGIVKSTNV
jgi:hypothetical protein